MSMIKTWFGKMKQNQKEWIRNLRGIQGFSVSYSISGRIGKHYCHACNEMLEIKRCEKIVNSESEEAKDFDFSFDQGSKIGNVKFSQDVYYCAKCDSEISIKDQKKYERDQGKVVGPHRR